MCFRTAYLIPLGLFSTLSLTVGTALPQEPVRTLRAIDAIEWPSEAGAGAPVPDGPLSRTRETYLPVLMPVRFLAFKTLDFVGDPWSYTVSVLAIDAKQSISGTRVSFRDPREDSAPVAAAIDIGMAEQSIFASFKRHGAAYMLTIECRRPNDVRCAKEDYVRALIGDMEVVGGSRGDPDPSQLQFGAGAPLPSGDPADPFFTYRPPGELTQGSGTGVTSTTVHASGIRFPVEQPKAYLNSQVYGIGGKHGPPGSWKHAGNYAYPWRDNFCESRSRRTPACPNGTGHQGVDIRPSGPEDKTYWAVAAEDGKIASVGLYSVFLTGFSGTQYRYLHLEMAQLVVKQGDVVERGQRIGLISNDFGGTPTPVHLHFEILQNTTGRGLRHVPPYSSLVQAYQSFD